MEIIQKSINRLNINKIEDIHVDSVKIINEKSENVYGRTNRNFVE